MQNIRISGEKNLFDLWVFTPKMSNNNKKNLVAKFHSPLKFFYSIYITAIYSYVMYDDEKLMKKQNVIHSFTFRQSICLSVKI